ncbi:hypothetical protein Aduo_016435 [Ancylostoma duodenale]
MEARSNIVMSSNWILEIVLKIIPKSLSRRDDFYQLRCLPEERIDSPKGLTKKPPSKPAVVAKASSTAVLHRPLQSPPSSFCCLP